MATIELTAPAAPADAATTSDATADTTSTADTAQAIADTATPDKGNPTEPGKDSTDTTRTDADKSVSAWARANKAARLAQARAKELEAKVAELEAKAAAAPDEQTARQQAMADALKQPGAAKKLLEAGWTFEQIVAELADIDSVDPKVKAIEERLDAAEAKRKAELEEAEKAAQEQRKANSAALAEQARKTILDYSIGEDNAVVTNEKDPRNGTKRWGLVAGDESAVAEAHSAVVEWIGKHRPNGVTHAEAQSLVGQALDQLELAERARLVEKSRRIAVTTSTDNRAPESPRSITERTDAFPTGRRSESITNDLRGPAPIARNKGRFVDGPRRITTIG